MSHVHTDFPGESGRACLPYRCLGWVCGEMWKRRFSFYAFPSYLIVTGAWEFVQMEQRSDEHFPQVPPAVAWGINYKLASGLW